MKTIWTKTLRVAKAFKAVVPRALVMAACLLAVVVMAIRLMTRIPFFEETVNMRYLWMMAHGMRPYEDFCCMYSVLAHILTIPYFRLFPESAYNMLALRLYSTLPLVVTALLLANHSRRISGRAAWGLLGYILVATSGPPGRFFAEYSVDHFAQMFAVAALVLFFRPATPARVGWAAALCVLSAAFTPKYAIFLALGGMAYVGGRLVKAPRDGQLIVAGGAGFMGALVLVWLLYDVAGCSFFDSIHWLWIQSKYQGTVVAAPRLWAALRNYFFLWPFNGLVLAGGLAAWFHTQRTVSWRDRAGPLGVLLGVAIAAAMLRQILEQYYTPVLVTYCVFVPFLGLYRPWPACRSGTAILFLGIVALVLLHRLPHVAGEIAATPYNTRNEKNPFIQCALAPPGLEWLTHTQDLLRMIPPDEGVIGMWNHHPIFRRDATYVTTDDRPSLFSLLPPDHPERLRVAPDMFRRQLERTPPAFICLAYLDRNYPPGLFEVCRDFLATHRDIYTEFVFAGTPEYIRTDLLKKAGARQETQRSSGSDAMIGTR